ncbi:MAG: hypothetical protein JJ899_02700 [Alphaproteobacteria bacterium]|nr:hypothetical protein [Alphaproteobacteria bacterium]
MIRPTSLVLLALAAAAGGALFHVSFEVSALDDRLAALNKDIRDDREAIHVLRAEWSFLNQPERLEELARRHLDLMPVAGNQLTGAGALPVRPEPAAPDAAPDGDTTGLGTAIRLLAGTPRSKPSAPDLPADRPSARPGVVPVVATPAPSERSLDDVLREISAPGAVR